MPRMGAGLAKSCFACSIQKMPFLSFSSVVQLLKTVGQYHDLSYVTCPILYPTT